VRALSGNWQTVNEVKAQLIIEAARDAIEAFGDTHQEEKVELRVTIEKAELIISPDSIDSLKKRAEKFVLRFLYPRNPIVRNTLFVLIALITVTGILFSIKKALSEQTASQLPSSVPTPTPTPAAPTQPVVQFIPVDQKDNLIKSFRVKGTGDVVRLKFLAKNLDLAFDFDAPTNTYSGLLLREIVDHFSLREHVKFDLHAFPTGVTGGVWYPDWKLVVKGQEVVESGTSLRELAVVNGDDVRIKLYWVLAVQTSGSAGESTGEEAKTPPAVDF
jgi:hypothetical protein